MTRVIVESPFAGAVDRNIQNARRCLRDCILRGESPIASHLLLTQPGILRDDVPEEREQGIAAGLDWSEVADRCVAYIDHDVSDGMRRGIERARWWGVPIEERRIGVEVSWPVVDEPVP